MVLGGQIPHLSGGCALEINWEMYLKTLFQFLTTSKCDSVGEDQEFEQLTSTPMHQLQVVSGFGLREILTYDRPEVDLCE